MKTKRFLAGVAAAVFALSSMTVTAFAESVDDDEDIGVLSVDEDVEDEAVEETDDEDDGAVDESDDNADEEDGSDEEDGELVDADADADAGASNTNNNGDDKPEGNGNNNSQTNVTYENSASAMTNEFLRLDMNTSSGRFILKTTGGNPESATDDNKLLLFSGFYSAFTSVSLDGNAQEFGAGTSVSDAAYDETNKCITITKKHGDITVTQTLTYVQNPSTGRRDVVQIKYTATNNGTETHKVGARITLDTMLGSHDDAPFRIPAIGNVTTEKEYEGADIPEFWQAFDSLEEPSVVAQGSFLRDTQNRPDKVQFTNWARVIGTKWGYQIKPDTDNGDSAVSVIWNEKDLAAGATRVYTTYYGLSQLSQISTEDGALVRWAVEPPTYDWDAHDYQPARVTGYITNTGNQPLANAGLHLDVPQGAEIVNGNTDVGFDTLAPGEERQATWQVRLPDNNNSQSFNVSITNNGNVVKPGTPQTITRPEVNDPDYNPTHNNTNTNTNTNNNNTCTQLPPAINYFDPEIISYMNPANRPMVSSEGVMYRETVANNVAVKPTAESSSSNNVIAATGGVFDTETGAPVTAAAGIVGAIAVLGAAALVVLNKRKQNR